MKCASNRLLIPLLLTAGLISQFVGCRRDEVPLELTREIEKLPTAVGRMREYRRVFQEAFDDIATKCPDSEPENIDARNLRDFVTLAYLSNRMYQLTQGSEYLEQTQQTFQAVLHAWEQQPDLMATQRNPFFVVELFFQVEAFLKMHKRLRPADEKIIRKFVNQIKPVLSREDNQDLAYTVGLTLLMKSHPKHANFRRWKASVERVWQQWYSYKHNIENATTYTAIGWNAVFALARNLQWHDKLDDPVIRQVFEDYRDLVTPAGAVPNWGDSYFGKSWTYWVLLLENAARQYKDDQFALAAEKVFWWGVHNQPMTGDDNEETNFSELVRLKPLADLIALDVHSVGVKSRLPESSASTEAAWKPAPRARILDRRTASGRTQPDKLVLATGDQHARHFVLVDLFATGYHAHFNRRGAVLYYESQGNSLFHSLDRHNKSLEDASSFVVMAEKFRDTFPSNHQQLASHWITERIPLRLLANDSQDNPDLPEADLSDLVLRFSAKRKTPGVLFDNLRLAGPAGRQLLDDFADAKSWKGDVNVRTLDDGNRCLAIGGDPGMTFVSPGDWFARKVYLNDYTHLEYDWKDLAPRQRNRFLVRIYPREHRLEHFDFDARNHHAFPEIACCSADLDQGNASATIEMRHHKIHNSRWVRRIILLRTGALILIDWFYLPANAESQLVGPVWNYHQQEIKRHNHWFIDKQPERTWYQANEQGERFAPLRTLVWFPPDQGRTNKIDRRLHSGFATTVFSQQIAKPGTWTTTVCVVHPVAEDQDAEQIARSLSWERDGGAFRLRVGDHLETVQLDRDDVPP